MSFWTKIFGPGPRPNPRFRIIQLSNGMFQVQEYDIDYDTNEWVYQCAWEREKTGKNSWGCIFRRMIYDTLEEAEQGLADLKKMYTCIEEEDGKVVRTSD